MVYILHLCCSGWSTFLELFKVSSSSCVSVTSDPAWLISRKPFPGRILVHCCSSGAHSDGEAESVWSHRFRREPLQSRKSIQKLGPEARNPLWGTRPSSVGFNVLFILCFYLWKSEKVEIFSLILITQHRAQRAAAGHPSETANHSKERQQRQNRKKLWWSCNTKMLSLKYLYSHLNLDFIEIDVSDQSSLVWWAPVSLSKCNTGWC